MSDEVKELRDQLAQLEQEVAAGKEFVNIAAHQLQEPLSSMKWQLESMLADRAGELTEQLREAVNKVYVTNESTISLMRDLLTIARMEGGRLKLNAKPTDLVAFVRQAIRRHEPAVKEHQGVMYFTQPKEKLPPMPIDPTLFNQVIDNLISNAIKYDPTKTHITVTISAEDKTVTVAVNNRGKTIPEEKQAGLFKKFYRAKTTGTQKTSGTGLGLFITKQIVEMHHGTISFTSKEGAGTTLTIKLPMP